MARAGFCLCGFAARLEDRFGDLDIPIAENVIDEVIGGAGGVVETQRRDRRSDIGHGLRRQHAAAGDAIGQRGARRSRRAGRGASRDRLKSTASKSRSAPAKASDNAGANDSAA